jgi:hypothetical protein
MKTGPCHLPRLQERVVSVATAIEQHVLDTNAGEKTVLSCYRYLNISGVEKMNNIYT